MFENKAYFCSGSCLKDFYIANKLDIPINYDSDHEEKESYEVFKSETKKNISKNLNDKANKDKINYDYDYDPMEDF